MKHSPVGYAAFLMSHGDRTCLARLSQWMGRDLDREQIDQLDAYVQWLGDEGSRVGGIGPGEARRLWERHICDSLAFGCDGAGIASLVDVGSGVGLPGIPLAVAFPETEVTLVERSGRRADALRRVSAILGVPVTVFEGDVAAWGGSAHRATFRASLPLIDAATAAVDLLEPDGHAWFGLGRGPAPEALRHYRTMKRVLGAIVDVEEVWVPPEVLDSGVWLLRMTLL